MTSAGNLWKTCLSRCGCFTFTPPILYLVPIFCLSTLFLAVFSRATVQDPAGHVVLHDHFKRNIFVPIEQDGKLNATVTLVRSLKTSQHVDRIFEWILSVKHLAQHTCILVESASYIIWLQSKLYEKFEERLSAILYSEIIRRVRLIDVSNEFRPCIKRTPKNTSVCGEEIDTTSPDGYKRMCRLWFSAVWKHLAAYDFILRFDLDNEYLQGEWPTHIEYFGTVACTFVSGDKYKVGIHDFIWDGREQTPTMYPETNLMFVNVKWALSDAALDKIFDRVEESNCICINRWGDLVLWGDTLRVLEKRAVIMSNWSYYHGSHGKLISSSIAKYC
jgi:hypothetical protein